MEVPVPVFECPFFFICFRSGRTFTIQSQHFAAFDTTPLWFSIRRQHQIVFEKPQREGTTMYLGPHGPPTLDTSEPFIALGYTSPGCYIQYGGACCACCAAGTVVGDTQGGGGWVMISTQTCAAHVLSPVFHYSNAHGLILGGATPSTNAHKHTASE